MNLALFDFDGTLTERELFGEFLQTVVPRRRWLWGRVVLAPVVVAYRLGWISGVTARRLIVRVALRGLDAAQFAEAGALFAAAVVPKTLRAEMMARLGAHQAAGDRIVVVSGAFHAVLEPWCRAQGVELLCSALAVESTLLTGQYAGAQCVGEEKLRRIQAHLDLSAFECISAYGDTAEDLSMLSCAHRRHYRGDWLSAA